MAQKNAVYQVDNGSGFDEIHFRTNEDMIIGATQKLETNGYRKLPEGLILQWGSVVFVGDDAKKNNGWYNFPITFPNCVLNLTGTINAKDSFTNYVSLTGYVEKNNNINFHVRFGPVGVNTENAVSETIISWVAIGY